MRCGLIMRFVAPCFATFWLGLSALAGAHTQVSGPVAHDNLAVYFVHGSAAQGAVPMSLEEALANERVKVSETGSVNALMVENVGDDEVFVQAGDIVKGGQQDRVLSVDLLLPPQSGRVLIPAFCVEPGRWSARGQEDPRQFSTSTAAMPSHEAKLAIQSYVAQHVAAVLPRADASAPQAEIWAKVRETQQQLSRSVGAPVAAAASPSSLQLSLENAKLRDAQAAYFDALQSAGESADDIVGYVFAINGKITGGDVYASSALFRKMWRKLLIANITEAIIEKNRTKASPPSPDDVQAFLTAADSVPPSERVVNTGVRLATGGGDSYVSTGIKRADGSWVHRNYLAR
jgi:ARG and Rhodanese-Phosphatase-superfamily-associated Protein domain